MRTLTGFMHTLSKKARSDVTFCHKRELAMSDCYVVDSGRTNEYIFCLFNSVSKLCPIYWNFLYMQCRTDILSTCLNILSGR